MRFIPKSTVKRKTLSPLLAEGKIKKTCKKYNLDLFYLFGSHATGNSGPLSDIDCAYYSSKKINILHLISDLSTIFNDDAIDVVDITKAPPPLAHRILRDGKCLYSSNRKIKIAIEMHIEAQYFDTIPLRKQYFKQMKTRIKNGTYGYRHREASTSSSTA